MGVDARELGGGPPMMPHATFTIAPGAVNNSNINLSGLRPFQLFMAWISDNPNGQGFSTLHNQDQLIQGNTGTQMTTGQGQWWMADSFGNVQLVVNDASGGTDPKPAVYVAIMAPHSFLPQVSRKLTAADYT